MTQLIALAGPSGAWRKSIIDRAIVFVSQTRFTALTELLQVVREAWFISCGRSRVAALRWQSCV
jgi:ribose 1,5-bisphosphokinase PhnN